MKSPRGETSWRMITGALPMLRAYVRRVTATDEQAKEIIQEACVRMLMTQGPDDPERYAAWARGVVRHVVARDWRTRRREQAELSFEDDVEEFVEPPTDPEAHLDARSWVQRLAQDMDSEGLELLYRRYVLQESGKELADDLASSPAAMRMRLMRLRSSVSAMARSTREAFAFAAATVATAASEFQILDI
jgi:RNA polymerase sigma factor (sigma-70 family)